MLDRITIISVAMCFIVYTVGHVIEALVLKNSDSANDLSLKFNVFLKYADAFVTWAKEFMPNNTGAEKMSAVIKHLQNIASKYNMSMSEDEIMAIAQRAYEGMKSTTINEGPVDTEPVKDGAPQNNDKEVV